MIKFNCCIYCLSKNKRFEANSSFVCSLVSDKQDHPVLCPHFKSSLKGNDRSPESQHVIITKFRHETRVVTLLQICEKLSMMMCIQNLVSFCQFVLKILSKNRILTSIKGSYSVANLQKTKIYNTNIDLVNDNVHTKLV